MKEGIIELSGTTGAVIAYAYALFADVSLMWFLAAGTAGGAVLATIGGKAFGIPDMGAKTVLVKLMAHICVVLMYGPLALGWAIRTFPSAEPEALAASVGGTIALFGTSVLLLMFATIVKLLSTWLSSRIPSPPNPPNPSNPPSNPNPPNPA